MRRCGRLRSHGRECAGDVLGGVYAGDRDGEVAGGVGSGASVGRIYPPIHSSIRAAQMADRSALPSAPIVGRIYPPIHSSVHATPMADTGWSTAACRRVY